MVTNSLQAFVFRAGRWLRARPIVMLKCRAKNCSACHWRESKKSLFGAFWMLVRPKRDTLRSLSSDFIGHKHNLLQYEQPNKSWPEINNLMEHSRPGDLLWFVTNSGKASQLAFHWCNMDQHGALCGQVLGPLRDFLKRNLEKCRNSACSGPFWSAWSAWIIA